MYDPCVCILILFLIVNQIEYRQLFMIALPSEPPCLARPLVSNFSFS